MKKLLLPVFVMAGWLMIPAQKVYAQNSGKQLSSTTFGIKLGPDFSYTTTELNGGKKKNDLLIGLEGGVYANIPIISWLYIRPSLMYERKGARYKGTNRKVRLNYIALPVDFVFKPDMSVGSGTWMVGVGPYLGYGFSGKAAVSGMTTDLPHYFTVDPFKTDGSYKGKPMLKRWDAGVNVQLGYEIANGFNIGLNANLGFISIAGEQRSIYPVKNTNFGVTLGYSFYKKRK